MTLRLKFIFTELVLVLELTSYIYLIDLDSLACRSGNYVTFIPKPKPFNDITERFNGKLKKRHPCFNLK